MPPGTHANRGGGFLRIYKRDHFVDSFTGEAAFLEGRIARPRRHSLTRLSQLDAKIRYFSASIVRRDA